MRLASSTLRSRDDTGSQDSDTMSDAVALAEDKIVCGALQATHESRMTSEDLPVLKDIMARVFRSANTAHEPKTASESDVDLASFIAQSRGS